MKIKFYFAKMVKFGHYFYLKIKLFSCSFLSHLGEVKTIFYLTPIYWPSVSINVFFCGITSHQLYFFPLVSKITQKKGSCVLTGLTRYHIASGKIIYVFLLFFKEMNTVQYLSQKIEVLSSYNHF